MKRMIGKIYRRASIWGVMCTACLGGLAAAGELALPEIFTDHLVLQREAEIPVWGVSDPNAEVSVELAEARVRARADRQGEWQARLPAQPAGGPYVLKVACGGRTCEVKDVLVGEVWLCGGQSNMAMALRNTRDGETAIRQSADPQLRLFTSGLRVSKFPLRQVEGAGWKICNPDSSGSFSAVGYYFGRELRRALGVPVGLVRCCYGGTRAEAWMDRAVLAGDPRLSPAIAVMEARFGPNSERFQKVRQELSEWQRAAAAKPGVQNADVTPDVWPVAWAASGFADQDWKKVRLPTPLRALVGKPVNGAFWFRKKFTLPGELAGRDLRLNLGVIKDFDAVFFNGEKIGATDNATPGYFQLPREYRVPAALTRAGEATVAIRIFCAWGEPAGLFGETDELRLTDELYTRETAVRLAGEWRYTAEKELPLVAGPLQYGAPRLLVEELKNSISGLYNGMLYPLHPYGIRGAIWFQGEANCGEGSRYQHLLPALIGDWRKLWGQGDFPFGIVQLALSGEKQVFGGGEYAAEFRWAQYLAHLNTPQTGCVASYDLAEVGDVHFRDKAPVGERLARWARAEVYGEKTLVWSGPAFKRLEIKGREVRFSFDHVGRGLIGNSLPKAPAKRLTQLRRWLEIEPEPTPEAALRRSIDAKLQVFAMHCECDPRAKKIAEQKGTSLPALRAEYLRIRRLQIQGQLDQAERLTDEIMAKLEIRYEAKPLPEEGLSLLEAKRQLAELTATWPKLNGQLPATARAANLTAADIEKALADLTAELAGAGREVQGLALAGEDGKFVSAQARIEGEQVVAWVEGLEAPKAAAYAWAVNPQADLFNLDGLPAWPFRTDNWSWRAEEKTKP